MDELGKIVGKGAPILGGVLNSFLPGSGLILNGIASLFGANPTDPDDILNKIKLDPDALVKLKQFEIEHAYDLLKILNADRDSARNRQVEFSKALGRDWVMDFLAVFITVSFVGVCFVIAFANINQSERDLFYMLIGTFGAVWSSVVQFYFGGSPVTLKQKNDLVLPQPEQTRK